MSAFRFEPNALAVLPPSAPEPARLEARAPNGVRWHLQHPQPPVRCAAPLLEALVEAWQRLAGSLAFRQERITNLGYVPTSTDPDALYRHAQAIALRPTPPLAASTWLALTVQSIGGKAEVEIPAGLAVQSVPAGSGRPQTFETDAVLRAHLGWNAIAVQEPPADPSALTTAATSGIVTRGGLSAGRRVVVTGSVAGRAFAAARTLSGAELRETAPGANASGPRARRIRWTEPLSKADDRPITEARAFELGAASGVFGANAQDWQSVPDGVRYRLSTPRGGLSIIDPRASGAIPVPRTLAAFTRSAGDPRNVVARGNVWIAASESGVFRSLDAGQSWTRTGNRAWTVTSLCWSDAGLFLGTASHGVLRSSDAAQTWEALRGATVVTQSSTGISISLGRLPRCSVGALGAFATGPDAALLLAGTNAGPYYQLLGDPAWYPHSDGLPLRGLRTGAGGPAVTAVALEPRTGALLLGTDRGLFRAPSLDDPWTAIALGSEPGAVSAIGVEAAGTLLIALESGDNYRWDGRRGELLTALPTGSSPRRAVRAFCETTAGHFWGGDAGCFWSANGQSWSALGTAAVRALAALPDGAVLAATRLEGSEAADWPGFALANDHLDLDGVQPQVALGPALIVDEAHGISLVVRVTARSEHELEAFGVKRRVTRLEIEPEPGLASCSRRNTLIYPSSRELGSLSPDVPDAPAQPEVDLGEKMPAHALRELGSRKLLVDARIPDPSGRRVLVSGSLLRTRLPHGTVIQAIASGAAQTLSGDVLATLQELPQTQGGQTALRVRTEDGLEGMVHVSALELLRADPHAEPKVLLRTVQSFERAGERAWIELDAALDLPLDPRATSVFANIVSASHGQRVANEVLGSGDPNQTSQRFKLMQPLCWQPQPDGSAEPVLEVRVSDRLWRRVDQRAELTAHDRAYSVECDPSGNTWICFGDGEHGERPAAGIENITVSYRAGGGSAGNLPAGSIRLIRTRSPGVKAARNPLPASGGSDIESLLDLRERIPLHARLPEHVVSVPDFLDHLRTLSGIAKVSARQLWNGHAHAVHLTIASSDADNGWALDPSSPLAASLRALSERALVLIDSVEIAWFSLQLAVAVAPDRDAEPVLAAVRAALLAAGSFEVRRIGDAVVPSTLIALAMSVTGVTNAVLRSLRPTDQPDVGSVEALPGLLARFDASASVVRPARLWLLGHAGAVPDSATPALRVENMEGP